VREKIDRVKERNCEKRVHSNREGIRVGKRERGEEERMVDK
jgi:hypothetical protein